MKKGVKIDHFWDISLAKDRNVMTASTNHTSPAIESSTNGEIKKKNERNLWLKIDPQNTSIIVAADFRDVRIFTEFESGIISFLTVIHLVEFNISLLGYAFDENKLLASDSKKLLLGGIRQERIKGVRVLKL